MTFFPKHDPLTMVTVAMALALAACNPTSPPGSDATPPLTPTPPTAAPLAPYTGRLKVEWGSLNDVPTIFQGQVTLEGAELLEVQPYVLEDDETIDPETLSFATSEWGILTDGMLLSVRVEVGGRLEFKTATGAAEVALDALDLEGRDFEYLENGTTYVEVSRISEEEWATALSYGERPTDRDDNLPEQAYYANLPLTRYNSVNSQTELYDESVDRYQTDAFSGMLRI